MRSLTTFSATGGVAAATASAAASVTMVTSVRHHRLSRPRKHFMMCLAGEGDYGNLQLLLHAMPLAYDDDGKATATADGTYIRGDVSGYGWTYCGCWVRAIFVADLLG